MTARRAAADRADAIREALYALVAEQGLHGATMADLARRAGVATGTIYVHYADKDALIVAAHREVKRDLGRAATAGWDASQPPRDRFLSAWRRVHDHLVAHRDRARFLLQLEASPYARMTHDEEDDVAQVWAAAARDLRAQLVDLPDELLYTLAFGPAVELAAHELVAADDAATLDTVAAACWRAITR